MPSTKCFSCLQIKSTKLLKCLHSVCVGCLQKHLTRSNEVRCAECNELTPSPGEGKPQWQTLPDNHAGLRTEKQSGQRLFCEECCEEEAATAQCLDCKTLLCGDHEKLHPRNRSTYKHKVKAIDTHTAAEAAATKQRFCIIHPDWKLHSFCCECNDFLCELCLKSGHGAGHSEMSVENAVAMMRSRVETSMASRSAAAATADGDGDSGSVVSEAIESVSNAIRELHDRTGSVSEEVQEYFNGIMELVKNRESKVLDDLDRLRSAKLLPLEDQKLRLQKSQEAHETVSSLLSSCDDPYDFLRMARWLEEAASKANATAEKDRKPCVASKLVFSAGDESKLAATIAESGYVMDGADMDASRSTMTCAPTVQVDRDLCIEVQAVIHAGQAISPEIATKLSIKVEVLSPNADSVECAAEASQDGRHLIATYRPAVTGKHRVTARHGNRHLNGSPAEVMAMPEQGTFSPDRCHADMQLSNGNMTARRSATNNGSNRSVCGTAVFRIGRVDIRVRMDGVAVGNVKIFLRNSTNPLLDDSTWGWRSFDGKSGRPWRGSQLGQPWQSGDVIRLSLDCDRHTLTGCHERTGTMETLSDLHGDLYLYVSMAYKGDQVTIL